MGKLGRTYRRGGSARRVRLGLSRLIMVGGVLMPLSVCAQSSSSPSARPSSAADSTFDATPQTRMRPIGEPSLVDQYPSAAASSSRASNDPASESSIVVRQETGARYAARQTSAEVPSLQYAEEATRREQGGTVHDASAGAWGRESATDASGTIPLSPVRQTVFQGPADLGPSNNAPALPVNPGIGGGMGMPSSSSPLPGTSALPQDLAPVQNESLQTQSLQATPDTSPVPVPRIDDGMATIDNCNCISAPSGYTAGGVWGCDSLSASPVTYVQPPAVYTPPPATIAPAVVTPQVQPTIYSPNNAGHRPLFTLGQDAYNAQLGRGIIGQPTAYVPGQYFRNFLRYLSP